MRRRIVTCSLPLCFGVVLKELIAVLILLSDLLFPVTVAFGGLSVDLYRLVHMTFFPWPRLP